MIVKVQWPLSTNHAVPQVLIYSQDRSVLTEIPATPEIKKKMQGKPKEFFHAEVNDWVLTIHERAPWQQW